MSRLEIVDKLLGYSSGATAHETAWKGLKLTANVPRNFMSTSEEAIDRGSAGSVAEFIGPV